MYERDRERERERGRERVCIMFGIVVYCECVGAWMNVLSINHAKNTVFLLGPANM